MRRRRRDLSRWHVNGVNGEGGRGGERERGRREEEKEEEETDDETSFETGDLARPSRRPFKG